MATKQKVPVSTRALVQRINRKLADEGRRIRAARGRAVETLGAWYIMNGAPGHEYVFEREVDLETRARELNCLAAFEALVP
jgi:hypothetical protein